MIHRLAFLTGIFNMAVFVVYFLQTRLKLTGTSAAGTGTVFIALLAIIISLATLPSGWLSDKVGNKPLAIASGCIAALGTLILLPSTHVIWIVLGGGLIGCATGLFYSSSWALGIEIIPPASASTYLGIQNLAAAGAGAVGAYLGGPIADYFSQNFPHIPGLGYIVLYAIFGLLCLLSAVALTRVRANSDHNHTK